jgi:hypothetical protein
VDQDIRDLLTPLVAMHCPISSRQFESTNFSAAQL